MIFLLSSDYSARYKEDVLRCLAAPFGATVQFRYDKVYVAVETLRELLEKDGRYPKEAIVCSVASKGVGVLLMVPVRKVSILRSREHGATISLTLQVQEVAYHHDALQFTTDLHSLAHQLTPQRRQEGEDPIGAYCFSSTAPANIETLATIALWESTVISLRALHAYADEKFFWVTIGIEQEGSPLETNTLHRWPSSLEPSKSYRLLTYHFQPKGAPRPDSKLEVLFGTALQSIVPPDTKVDSRYDLKAWSFFTGDNLQSKQFSWIRIRPADSWDLDLPVVIAAAYARWIGRSIVAGILVAVPAMLALVPQPATSISVKGKLILSICGVAAGTLATLASSLKIEKPEDK